MPMVYSSTASHDDVAPPPMTGDAAAFPLRNWEDRPVHELPELRALDEHCQAALVERTRRRQQVHETWHLDALPGVERARSPGTAVRIVYLIMAHRSWCLRMLVRLIRAVYSSAHAFLVHLDAKAPTETRLAVQEWASDFSNVVILARPRSVSWAGFSQVAVLLDGLASVVRGTVDFDYFINLSDADLALRTDGEIVDFLSGLHGRSLVQINDPNDAVQQQALHAALRRFHFVECGAPGGGFVVLDNTSSELFALRPRCCWGRSGQIVYGSSSRRLPSIDERLQVFLGSQWVVLHRDLAEHVVDSEEGASLAAAAEHLFLPDEYFTQTLVMNSRFRLRVANHNLRFIQWPDQFGDPRNYWNQLPQEHYGGPVVLNASHATALFQSPHLFARKADPKYDVKLIELWDEWMGAKLKMRDGKGAAAALQPRIGVGLLREDGSLPPPETAEDRAAQQLSQKLASGEGGRSLGSGALDELTRELREEEDRQLRERRTWALGKAKQDGTGREERLERPPPLGSAAGELLPESVERPLRLVALSFADGSSCTCSRVCVQDSDCCEGFAECYQPLPLAGQQTMEQLMPSEELATDGYVAGRELSQVGDLEAAAAEMEPWSSTLEGTQSVPKGTSYDATRLDKNVPHSAATDT